MMDLSSPTSLVIKEYRESENIVLDSGDIAFIDELNRKNRNNEILRIIVLPNKTFKLKANNFVGVVKFPSGIRVQIEPKIDDIKLFYIFAYLLDIKYFHGHETGYKEGDIFIDFIALLFKKEVDKILAQGLLKKYIYREENLKYLKGKLLINQQITLNSIHKDNFYCNYDEHTFDIIENQVIVHTLFLLIQIVQKDELRMELSELKTIFESVVSYKSHIMNENLDSIIFDRLNEYYERMIGIARLIINQNYVQDLSGGEVSAFSFVLDMNKVFENYIYKLFVDVFYGEKKIIGQKMSKNLLESCGNSPEVRIKPDIIIKNMHDDIEFVLDMKYKNDVKPSDIYQIISYALAHSVNSILIYPINKNVMSRKYKILNVDDFDKIYIKFFDLSGDNYCDYNDYIFSQKEQIKHLYYSCT